MNATRWRVTERAELLADLELEVIRAEQIAARPPSSDRDLTRLWHAQIIGRKLYAALLTAQAE